jgi:hypothetical protein
MKKLILCFIGMQNIDFAILPYFAPEPDIAYVLRTLKDEKIFDAGICDPEYDYIIPQDFMLSMFHSSLQGGENYQQNSIQNKQESLKTNIIDM